MRINVGNQIHAGLEEFGYPARKSSLFIKKRLVEHLDKHAEHIPEEAIATLKRQRELWLTLLEKEEDAQRRMEKIANTDVDAKRIMTVPSVGPQTAVNYSLTSVEILLASRTVDGSGASISTLVPKQNSTGGNTTLNGITKHGPKQLKRNLVQCAGVALQNAEHLGGNLGEWIRKMKESGKR